MKELYNEYFYVPEDGKVRDKVLLTRITVSVIAILFCIVAMSITAFAYFSHGITSSSNTIQSANYDLVITPTESVAAYTSGDNIYVLDNTSAEDLSAMSEDELYEYYNEIDVVTGEVSGEKAFEFTLEASENTTASVGYCKILIKTDANDPNDAEDIQTFYTQPIWKEADLSDTTKVSRLTVTIVVPEGKTVTVSFVPEWGTCSQEENTIYNNGVIQPNYSDSPEQENIPGPDVPNNSFDAVGGLIQSATQSSAESADESNNYQEQQTESSQIVSVPEGQQSDVEEELSVE